METTSRKICLVFIAVMLISTVSADGWMKFRHDLKNTGFYKGDSSLYLENMTLLWIFETDGWIRSSPAVADLDGDGKSEIVFGSDNGFLYALDSEGNLLWSFETGDAIVSSPVIVDIDERVSGLEVVSGSTDGIVYILNSKGDVLKKFNLQASIESSPAVADVDRDGGLDIIVGTNGYTVHVLSYLGAKRMSFPVEGRVVSSPLVVGSTPRIVAASYNGEVYGLTYSESRAGGVEGYTKVNINLAWNYSAEGEIVSSPAAANLVGSSYEEVVVGSLDKNLYILDSYSGKLLKKYLTDAPICSSPAVADLDGDGKSEIVFGSDKGMLYVMNSSWERVWSFKCDGAIKTSPVVADLNGDGRSEIIVGTDAGRLYVFSSVELPTPTTTTTSTSTTSSTTSTSTTTTTLKQRGSTVSTTSTSFVKPEIVIEEVELTTLAEDNPPAVGRVVGVSVNAGLTLLVVFLVSFGVYNLYKRM